jgi:cytochrome c oxidase subunit III
MATMVTSTKTGTKIKVGSGGKLPGPNGKKPGGNGWEGGDRSKRKFSPAKYRITMWVVLAAIVMMFAALSSAYIVLSAQDGRDTVAMPRMFVLSTGLILISSWTFEKAKRSLQRNWVVPYGRWLGVTFLLGLGFLGSQLLGWQQLARQGVYFSSHPHSTFFYFFTAVHGVHLLGGLGLLAYLLGTKERVALAAESEKTTTWNAIVGRYWHTMDALWLWLFLLLLALK